MCPCSTDDTSEEALFADIKPGMEMLRVYNSGSGTLSWIGRACNAKDQPCGVKKSGDMLYAANCSSYGASSNQYGLAIRPCKLCEGLVMNKDSETDGYTTCIPSRSGCWERV